MVVKNFLKRLFGESHREFHLGLPEDLCILTLEDTLTSKKGFAMVVLRKSLRIIGEPHSVNANWNDVWDNRRRVFGIFHTHPFQNFENLHYSSTDKETMTAFSLALGKSLYLIMSNHYRGRTKCWLFSEEKPLQDSVVKTINLKNHVLMIYGVMQS